MKTLVVILHYNTFEYTDQLYQMLKPYEHEDYDLIVVDNGSKISSKYSEFVLDTNVYFGGALNVCFDYILENPQYDSLLFLNNDLIIHGQNFVKSIRQELNEYDVVTPCIIQPEKTQIHWKQMLNWGSKKTRDVKWIDLQSPMFSRKFIEKVGHIDDLLCMGWGIDVLFGLIAEKNKMKTGVCDFIPVIHIGSATIKKMNIVSEYCRKAEHGQWEYFQKANITKESSELRKWAENYEYKN